LDVVDLHWCYHQARDEADSNRIRRKALQRTRQSLKKLNHLIMSDVLISHAFKTTWRHEYTEIQAALGFLEGETPNQALKPYPPFTRRLGSNSGGDNAYAWSGQSFWTPIIAALIPLWQRAGLKDNQAFKDIAELLSTAFPPYPNKPALVKQRYLRASRHA
jgi:hypothetical protein